MTLLEGFTTGSRTTSAWAAIALTALVTVLLIAFGHAEGTLDPADTVGLALVGGSVMLAIGGLTRSS